MPGTLGEKKLPEAVRRLKGHAIVALGSEGGPWRIGITADPWGLRKSYASACGRPLIAGAMVWVKNDALARFVRARLDLKLAEVRRRQHMPEPWFVMEPEAILALIVQCADAERAETFSHAAWIAKAEGAP